MTAEPTLIPDMSPPAAVATAVLPLDHVSTSVEASLNIAVPPTQIVVKPMMGAGLAAIVLTTIVMHPLAIV